MKLGDKAILYSEANPLNPIQLVEIVESGIASGINNLSSYKTNEDTLFYMRPELLTKRHYNVANKDFWIKEIK